MSQPNFPFPNILKGRIAETLVEELFLQSGWSVERTGIENSRAFTRANPPAATTPSADLRVTKESASLAVEVKYRETGVLDIQSLSAYPDDTYIIVVYRSAATAEWGFAWFNKFVRYGDIKYLTTLNFHELGSDHYLNAAPFSLSPILVTDIFSQLRETVRELCAASTRPSETVTTIADTTADESSEDDSASDSSEDDSSDDSADDSSEDDSSEDSPPAPPTQA